MVLLDACTTPALRCSLLPSAMCGPAAAKSSRTANSASAPSLSSMTRISWPPVAALPGGTFFPVRYAWLDPRGAAAAVAATAAVDSSGVVTATACVGPTSYDCTGVRKGTDSGAGGVEGPAAGLVVGVARAGGESPAELLPGGDSCMPWGREPAADVASPDDVASVVLCCAVVVAVGEALWREGDTEAAALDASAGAGSEAQPGA